MKRIDDDGFCRNVVALFKLQRLSRRFIPTRHCRGFRRKPSAVLNWDPINQYDSSTFLSKDTHWLVWFFENKVIPSQDRGYDNQQFHTR